MSGAPPDMDITAFDKERKSGAKIGVGWTQADGSVALVLNPGSCLIYHPSMVYKVKPRPNETTGREKTGWQNPTPVRQPPPSKHTPFVDDFDDDTPF